MFILFFAVKPNMSKQMPCEDVARLVLGYLRDKTCKTIWKQFQEQCPDLKDFVRQLENGKECITTVHGKDIIHYLNNGYKHDEFLSKFLLRKFNDSTVSS
jgi:hypothetical protein